MVSVRFHVRPTQLLVTFSVLHILPATSLDRTSGVHHAWHPSFDALYHDEIQSADRDPANVDKEDSSTAREALKKLWGSSRWPPEGEPRVPPESPGASAYPWLVQLMLLVVVAACACVTLICRKIADKLPSRGYEFATHTNALVAAISWRHTHKRALILHLFRVAVPALFLWMIYMMRNFLAEHANKPDAKEVMSATTGASPQTFVDGIIEYALTVTIVYVVMMSNLFFVWHVSAESESGFRHLLHVSGLSRPAYMLATAGVDGVLLTVFALLVMVLLAGTCLHLRMVLWTSPVLLLGLLVLLAFSTVSTGYLLALICPSARSASVLSQVAMVLVIFVAPFSPMWEVVPPPGQQRWSVLALPTLSAYRAVFELVAGCVKGRCLCLTDVLSAHGAPPWTMVVGRKGDFDFTPPESLASFVGLVLVQVMVQWLCILLLDRRHNPPLHDSGVAYGGSNRESVFEGSAVLEVRELEHQYGWLQTGSSGKVLNGVSLSVGSGSMLGLLGPNGAGKTTTIRCITGEERPSQGNVAINPSGIGDRQGAYIGLCPQETVVNSDLTVAENLFFFACLRGCAGSEAERCVEHLLIATRLEQKRDWLPDTLSGGMRRRLAVGCAMVASPSVAILDEPTTGLDPLNRRGIWTAINEIRSSGGCCLLTTHLLEEAEALCSHIVIMTKGQIAAQGSVQSLKEQWGKGYMLNVDSEEGQRDGAQKYIQSLLAEEDRVPVKNSPQGQITFKFTQDEEALGHLIIAIARGRVQHGIKHWGVSQASLEDAYVRIIQQDETKPPVV
mmetsp:Transcript_81309/g.211292  ORF Transcript_81309/g.211292 Transcript_81309/m.211292 type:complete len:787 (-) Transcript_81309:61-2421(-)